jgi:hypothetical protein
MTNMKTWHFSFNRLDDLPEILVQGHERAYLSWLFANKSIPGWAIDAAALDEYVRVFSSPGAARAGFAYYRAFFDDARLAATISRKHARTSSVAPSSTSGARPSQKRRSSASGLNLALQH